MRADWWTVICLCAFLCGCVNCASVNIRSEVVKKDTFVITGNATTNARKTELNIHVESKGKKPQGPPPPLGPLLPSVTSTEIPPKPGQNNKATGQVTGTSGQPGKNQINASTKVPTNQQPSKGLEPSPPSSTPTKRPSKLGQNNIPTGKGISATGTAGQNQINASTERPTNQQPSKGPGPTPTNATPAKNPPTPGQNIKPTGQVTSVAGTPGQNISTKGSKNQQPNQGPGPTPLNATPTQNPSKPGQNTKPTGDVTSTAGTPGQKQINASTNQQPSKGPGPTPTDAASTRNPSKPGQKNKPTGHVTTAGGTSGQNQINALTKAPTNNGPTSTQNSPKPEHPSEPTIEATSTAPAPISSNGNGEPFQVVKPTSKIPKTQTLNPAQSGATSSPAASKVPATAAPIAFSDEENMALIAHNSYRAIHGSKPMELKGDLVTKAREMAEKLATNDEGDLIHEKSEVLDKMNQRESLAKVCSKEQMTTLTAIEQIVDKWYGEVCLYNFENPDIAFNGTSHFTQLVWNDTSDLGFGVAQKKFDGNYCLFAAARYRPQGNINDKEAFKRNIKKGKFDPFVNNCVVSSQADDTHM